MELAGPRENREKGGVVIRPHYPYCGHTEDPAPIIQGLVDALEIDPAGEFSVQEWYRYLNCGYRVAVCGGTDKMSAGCALGWKRTYAKLDQKQPLTYAAWAKAVRAGRVFSTNGPLLDLTVDGRSIGDTIKMPATGGTVEIQAWAECFHPLQYLEVVCNGKVIARSERKEGSRRLEIRQRVPIRASGWLAARCRGIQRLAETKIRSLADAGSLSPKMAHTSPVYIACGDQRAFDGPAMEHMLALVSGGVEYLRKIAACFDEATRTRLVKQLQEAQNDLKCRLVVEGGHSHHHDDGQYHTHGHGVEPDHRH